MAPIDHQNPFTYLPQELTMDILSRLPTLTIMNCKLVCKQWRNMVESPEFALLHLAQSSASASASLPTIKDLKSSNSHPHLGFLEDNEVLQNSSDGLVLSHKWPNPNRPFIHSSVHGLLFMYDSCNTSQLFICNPLTREYISFEIHPQICTMRYVFGFGVSRTGQYKLAKISSSNDDIRNPQTTCEVYTLRTGQWRSVAIGSRIACASAPTGALVNGNLHWFAVDHGKRRFMIHCLDLETELFTSLYFPPLLCSVADWGFSLSALRGRLCLCDDSYMDEIEIRFMNEYGDERSWRKELVIKRPSRFREIEFLNPIRVLKDGGILFALGGSTRLFYCSNARKGIREVKKKGDFDEDCEDYCSNAVIYTPNFVRLKTLVMENMRVKSF